MDDITTRLSNCFQTVFPDLTPETAPQAAQSTLAEWDSVAAITLANVVEEEFGIEVDFDRMGELDSFTAIRVYLASALPA